MLQSLESERKPAARVDARKAPTARRGPRAAARKVDVAYAALVAFRQHPHLSNVLTHVSRSDWHAVAGALRAILDLRTRSRRLSPLACNIVELMCAERGVTGRILKPYFRALLEAILPPRRAARLIAHVDRLYRELERGRAAPPCAPAPSPSAAEGTDDVRCPG